MFSDWQTPAALLIVLLALGYLGWRRFSRRRRDDCGCPPDRFKASLKR